MQRELRILCSALMVWTLATVAAIPLPAARRDIRTLVTELPAGWVVQVTLDDKRKMRGRLGDFDDTGFDLQSTLGDRVSKEHVLFSPNVRSVKAVDKGMSTGAKVGLGALAGVGALFLY